LNSSRQNDIESGSNTNLKSLSASGHDISSSSLTKLGKAIASGKSQLTSVAIGNGTMGDEGVCALCQGLGTSKNIPLEEVDLSWKGM
jgi:hypothetical protein